jgi:hypothetical protein
MFSVAYIPSHTDVCEKHIGNRIDIVNKQIQNNIKKKNETTN